MFTKIVLIAFVSFLMLVAAGFYIIFGNALAQKEYHLPIFIAIAKLALSDQDLVEVDSWKLVKKTGTPNAAIINYVRPQGWEYVEQTGSGLIFEKNAKRATVSIRHYSSFYQLIDISELVAPG